MTTPSNLESELELELCPFMKKCNPDDDDIENYCCLNYENCLQYQDLQRRNVNRVDLIVYNPESK